MLHVCEWNNEAVTDTLSSSQSCNHKVILKQEVDMQISVGHAPLYK